MPAVWLESVPFATQGDVIRVIGMHSNQLPKFCSTSLVIINYAIGLSLARTKKANRSDDDSNQSHLSAWSGFLKRLLRPIDQIGQQENLRPKERRRLIVVNRMISLFALCLLIRQVLLLVFDANQDLLSFAGISLLVFCGSILILNATGRFFWGKILLSYGTPILITAWLLYLYGYDPADSWMTITGFMMISLILFGVRERIYLAGALLTGLVCMLVLALLPRFVTLPGRYSVGPELTFMIDWFFSPVIFCFMALVARMIYRNSILAEARADQLLLNILPAGIAERLKEGEESIAERFPEASIIFVDVVNFTRLSSQLEPREVVKMLDSVFRRFDAVSESHGAEKIKTIGDGYMAATGVPRVDPRHASNAARTALAFCECIREAASELNLDLEIRVGIHCGPVVAGVIGRKKFIYDMWGDTVNVASRMESHGEEGKVQVSRTFRDLLGDEFEFSEPRKIEIKGKGSMETFFLLREKSGG